MSIGRKIEKFLNLCADRAGEATTICAAVIVIVVVILGFIICLATLSGLGYEYFVLFLIVSGIAFVPLYVLFKTFWPDLNDDQKATVYGALSGITLFIGGLIVYNYGFPPHIKPITFGIVLGGGIVYCIMKRKLNASKKEYVEPDTFLND